MTEKEERKKERGLASIQMGYDVFSPPEERERTLSRAVRNYGKKSVLKMLANKIRVTKKERTRKIVAADYEKVKNEMNNESRTNKR